MTYSDHGESDSVSISEIDLEAARTQLTQTAGMSKMGDALFPVQNFRKKSIKVPLSEQKTIKFYFGLSLDNIKGSQNPIYESFNHGLPVSPELQKQKEFDVLISKILSKDKTDHKIFLMGSLFFLRVQTRIISMSCNPKKPSKCWKEF